MRQQKLIATIITTIITTISPVSPVKPCKTFGNRDRREMEYQ